MVPCDTMVPCGTFWAVDAREQNHKLERKKR
jgi:hypothetical protein